MNFQKSALLLFFQMIFLGQNSWAQVIKDPSLNNHFKKYVARLVASNNNKKLAGEYFIYRPFNEVSNSFSFRRNSSEAISINQCGHSHEQSKYNFLTHPISFNSPTLFTEIGYKSGMVLGLGFG
jgi:hypothetical protein